MHASNTPPETQPKQVAPVMLDEDLERALVAQNPATTTDGSVDFRDAPATKAKTGGWKAAPLIFGMELCERMASLGLQRNLVTYFVNEMHIAIPKAANMVSNFVGTLYLTPFIGGFLADAYLGRFLTINLFASVQLAGMVLLTISAVLPSLRPPKCSDPSQVICPRAHGSQIAVLFTGLYLVALGNGGIKPNVSSMGADQFDEGDPHESKHMSSFFNWFYFIISVGSLISITVFVYLQDNVGFGWGFGIPSGLLVGAIVVFCLGAPLYRYKPPSGSSLTRIAQVIVAALTKKNAAYPADAGELYEDEKPDQKIEHSNQFRFLDRAAILRPGMYEKSPWHLCTVTQVEEVKMVLRLLPIWATTAFVWTALAQMETFSVEQGATMQRRLGPRFVFPPASMSVFELINVLLFLPLYDKFFVPFARKFTGHEQGITALQRIGIGILASILSMVSAALVEARRIDTARKYGFLDKPKAVLPITIFWLIPQYFLRGTTEIFTQVGQLEFFYKESPRHMRSFGTALYLSTIAVGHFLSTAVVTIVNRVTSHGDQPGWLTNNLNRSKLSNFYWLLAAMSSVNFLFYLACSKWYKYKEIGKSRQPPETLVPESL
ncbi:protein NRT1/ PTR FAMILY 8.2 isoform X2 [Selaginella moellendorffii]|uniref:protein NRT1/ PTR FAMILY 8.2 isoform X2 n=1 Tax=Selaginella moellendorffii TaxID=88036 RepID=UPI000D1CD569|nr:protein NRT1/ PTR FAMILY 8.2 isoform X2 [Selaginella moellendorffii]|eukprot:XP_024522931.1 protein NRT1/ PTR FAMILY 8.2 isoform X2 [Selaginella moellendorffii]